MGLQNVRFFLLRTLAGLAAGLKQSKMTENNFNDSSCGLVFIFIYFYIWDKKAVDRLIPF